MTVKIVKGKTRLRHFPRTASVTFTAGDFVIFTSGLLATALNNTTTGIVGVIQENVASTDSDFATAAVKSPVEVPADANCVMEIDVGNGTLLTTSIGTKFGLTSASTVDFGDTSNTVVTCVGYVSGSKGLFQLENDAVHNA